VDLPERPELQALLDLTATPADSPTLAPGPMDFPEAANQETQDDGFLLAIIVLAGMAIALLYAIARLLFVIFSGKFPAAPPAWVMDWVIPALSLVGLLVAGYLSYIEITLSQAFCGPVGNCNAVQASSYARIFGILPVGVLGGVGYLAILLAWWANRQHWGLISTYAPLALFSMALFGTIFSTYLTYLEPFVIKAVCIWCVTSAVLITLIMLASLPAALRTLPAEDSDNN